jgi:cytochrome P450
LLKIVARISNRVFLGQPVCRNEEWLKTSIDYSANVTKTVMVLRMFPPVLHPIVAMFLPSAWAIPSHLKVAKRILIPIMEARREAEKNEPGYQKPNDLFQWMMDAANENDSQPDKMAHRQLIMSLASVHTTTMAAAHALYDMCAMPEYFEHLREEILDVLREDGGMQKTSLNKMRKMDSFLKESQRMSPASLCRFNAL